MNKGYNVSKIRFFLIYLVLTLSLLFAFFVFFCQFYLDSWFGDTVNNFRQQYILFFGIFTLISIFLKEFKFAALFSFFMVFFILCNRNPTLYYSVDKTHHPQYTLTTFNVYDNNTHKDRIVKMLKGRNSDILVLEEVTQKFYQRLIQDLPNYRYYAIDSSDNDNHVVIFSRYPFVQLYPSVSNEKNMNRYMVNILCHLPDRVIHLIGVHLSNPLIFNDFGSRAEEYNDLADYITSHSENVIIAGDFNTTPWSEYMKQFLTNTKLHLFIRSLFFQPTWERKVPFITIPIDHVLFGNRFSVQDVHVDPDSFGSDHHPVTVKFGMK